MKPPHKYSSRPNWLEPEGGCFNTIHERGSVMPETVSALLLPVAFIALGALLILLAFWYCAVAHDHENSPGEFTACLFYRAAAAVLRRGNGRHRMEDLYELQAHIRADWRELTPRS